MTRVSRDTDRLIHGKYNNTLVAPTFRPDALFALDENYIKAELKKLQLYDFYFNVIFNEV